MPCITRYPPLLRTPSIPPAFATVMDIAPTVLSLASIQHPYPTFRSRPIVPLRGASMLPLLRGESSRVHADDYACGWEICGRGAIRKENWKAVFIPKPKGPERWQLYDLAKDPGETEDLADAEAEKMAELMRHWESYVLECGVVPLQPELGTYVVAAEEQMPVSVCLCWEVFWTGSLGLDDGEVG